jgi:hypothetical protein
MDGDQKWSTEKSTSSSTHGLDSTIFHARRSATRCTWHGTADHPVQSFATGYCRNRVLMLISNRPSVFIFIRRDIDVKGRRYDQTVSVWLSTFLATPDLDLVYFDEQFEPQHTKKIEPEFPNEALDTDAAAYHDMSPFHLGSLESINDLNQRLENPVKIHNFRPNIIVSGVGTPYGEVRYLST